MEIQKGFMNRSFARGGKELALPAAARTAKRGFTSQRFAWSPPTTTRRAGFHNYPTIGIL
jgi:hypothetical protein